MFLMAVNFCSETKDVWSLVGKILGVFKIVIPLLIIIFGMIDLGKAVVASKDDEVKKAAYDGELTFVPTRIGAYKIVCTATSSVSERDARDETIIKVESSPKEVEVPSKWLENNLRSVIFLSIGTLCLIGIVVLLFVKPKEKTQE